MLLKAILEPLGSLLGRSWTLVGRSLAAPGGSAGVLGSSVVALGRLLAVSEGQQGHFMKKCFWLQRERDSGGLRGLLARS